MSETATPVPLLSRFNTIFVKCSLLFAVAMLVLGALLLFRFSSLTERIVTDRLRDLAHHTTLAISHQMADSMQFKVQEKLEESLHIALEEAGENGVYGAIFDLEGKLVMQLGSDDLGHAATARSLGTEVLRTNAPLEVNDGFHVAFPIQKKEAMPTHGVFVMLWDPAPSLAHLAEERVRVEIEAMIALIAILVGVSLAVRQLVTRPLVRLSDTITLVGEGRFDAAGTLPERGDEIGHISVSVKTMSARLEEARRLEDIAQMDARAQADVVELLRRGLKALAEGDLTAGIETSFAEKYEPLRQDFNAAISKMRQAMSEVRSNADSIQSGAEEISRASDDLSRRTESQAATLEETAAALDQLAASVKSAAEGAKEVSKTVSETNTMASENGRVMQNAIGAMSEIEKSSDQINEIIGVIDDIAFQTNLLALNAGVEAARAGAAGKGFAVVASEVRALAQRSSDAAKQIKTLISGSSQQVKSGAKLVDQAGEALMMVVTSVDHISDLISGIATGASEQAIGVSEINKGVNNLDQVTQQNAAMVEEATAAAHMLKSDAMSLNSMVSKFEVAMDGSVEPQMMELSDITDRANVAQAI
ncbi:MAG: methyl-accepting chemotaxis protein [Rhodobacteraceae bacterium]|nr:methyl-accepting chemotaxis protein [Paracoccaceae bacterium]